MSAEEIAAKLWGQCNLLRDEGVTYQPYYLIDLQIDNKAK